MSGHAKTVQWFTVPAGTPSAECGRCRQTVYWIVTDAGRLPVNCDVPGGLRPVRFVGGGGAVMKDNGRGIRHSCPQSPMSERTR